MKKENEKKNGKMNPVRNSGSYGVDCALVLGETVCLASFSHGHRCSIHSRISACNGSVKSSLKCLCTISVRPFRCSTFSVLSVSSTLSKTEALDCGGGPFKRDGALNCVTSLHRSVACFRLTFQRALCSAMERVSSVSRGLFPVNVPDSVCAFRSSCRPVDEGKIFVFLRNTILRPSSQPSVLLHS